MTDQLTVWTHHETFATKGEGRYRVWQVQKDGSVGEVTGPTLKTPEPEAGLPSVPRCPMCQGALLHREGCRG